MNIALFGGSFDPPHLGHTKIVEISLTSLDIDKLFIIPTYINPFKSGFFAPPNLRLKWLKKLFENLDKVEICDYEIRQNRPVATIETVRYLKEIYKPNTVYLIIGADNLKDLKKWQNYPELESLVEFVVASRDGEFIPKDLKKLNINANISSTKFRNNLNLKYIPKPLQSEVLDFYKRTKMSKIKIITDILENKKAENIEVIDMEGKDYIAKSVIIATTLTGKHGLSLSDDIKNALAEIKEKILHIESSDEWTVIDLGDVIIHLMSEAYRTKYDIEEFLEKLKFER
ncbi:nicotinate (nicotinamide) nucleotide adenylyltransferase [Campylobacter corcagiensis]|uniref:Multifunctional fusion protein n=1 Tax=Campylobacter corcagiensis TaxID=1448857 RepID=A0A7M1LGC1_9BACT|nr:nicotinate (nicotinamide) nucleotide adenylyltransferase [Campylobacter corcagiensis]QKF64163.1 fused nicotinate-mononucleotide adenylyltransferase / ribosomal silencing factor [Campylobacter corcagiensis]QOQ87642.1 nicotinate (nicotinamide) nucleotide adenylyltransferase [Campylobacter corcagiensis]